MRPLAYHITWGTYGTRLHGDPRKTGDERHNERGTPFVEADQPRWEFEKSRLKSPPVRLTPEQRLSLEEILPKICERGRWDFLTCAAGPDHVHLIVTSSFDPETIRRLAKRWAGEAMFEKFPTDSFETWWAECGSIRWIGDTAYLKNAISYVQRQRATRVDAMQELRVLPHVDPFDYDLRVD